MLDLIFDLIQGLFLIKIIFLVLTAFYIGFLLVVYKQAHAMQNVVNDDGASGIVNNLALLNIIVGILLFVAALVIL